MNSPASLEQLFRLKYVVRKQYNWTIMEKRQLDL